MTDLRRKLSLSLIMILLLAFIYYDNNKNAVTKAGETSIAGLELDLKKNNDRLNLQLAKQSKFERLIKTKTDIEEGLWVYQDGDSPRSLVHQSLRESISASGLNDLTVAVGREKQLKGLDSIRAIDFSVNGLLGIADQKSLYQFMKSLEQDAKLYHWSSLSVSQHAGKIRVSAVLRAYVYVAKNNLDKEVL